MFYGLDGTIAELYKSLKSAKAIVPYNSKKYITGISRATFAM